MRADTSETHPNADFVEPSQRLKHAARCVRVGVSADDNDDKDARVGTVTGVFFDRRREPSRTARHLRRRAQCRTSMTSSRAQTTHRHWSSGLRQDGRQGASRVERRRQLQATIGAVSDAKERRGDAPVQRTSARSIAATRAASSSAARCDADVRGRTTGRTKTYLSSGSGEKRDDVDLLTKKPRALAVTQTVGAVPTRNEQERGEKPNDR